MFLAAQMKPLLTANRSKKLVIINMESLILNFIQNALKYTNVFAIKFEKNLTLHVLSIKLVDTAPNS